MSGLSSMPLDDLLYAFRGALTIHAKQYEAEIRRRFAALEADKIALHDFGSVWKKRAYEAESKVAALEADLREARERVEKLTEERDEAVDRANGGSHEDWLHEVELRVAAEAERDEAYEDSRRSLDRLNRLVADKTGGIDPYTADGYLAHRLSEESNGRQAAESENARLREALSVLMAGHFSDAFTNVGQYIVRLTREQYDKLAALSEGGKDA